MVVSICPEEQCTGCAACFNICPHECISMVEDVEGFSRPVIDAGCCDDCGACQRVCPALHLKQPDHTRTPKVYACWHQDSEIRFQSASGGAFTAFAQHILINGGVVFGAAFDENMCLKHVAVKGTEDLAKLRSSKYVQSDIGRGYRVVREYLHQGKTVLFCGTPCQVVALNAFLGKPEENLLTCDILCKGVPSPGLFSWYVKDLENRYQARLCNINFRHKRLGWELVSTVAEFDSGRECELKGLDNSFMFGFSNGFTMRKACYQCPYANTDRSGDITLGDFWGIGESVSFHHDKSRGISLVFVNSAKGDQLYETSKDRFYSEERTLDEASSKQTVLKHSMQEPASRKVFFEGYRQLEYEELARQHLVDKGFKGLVKKTVPRSWIFSMKKKIGKLR